ncbi:MAG: ABC transporter ATP-binding protein [Acidobacteriota bacterium]
MQDAALTEPTSTLGMPPALLEIERLSLRFGEGAEVLRQVSLHVRRGEIVALVGESGCGKTLTALSILGLLPAAARTVGGRIELAGEGDLLRLDRARRRQIRAQRVSMIFQEPMSALNPVLSIGFQITESLCTVRKVARAEARERARELLSMVAMPDPERRLRSYPHQLSGGQLQRAMIAMALASEPDLLLADEPTTALDVTVQAQVIELLLDLRRRLELAVLLITHDLGVVAQCADRVLVMYCGQIVEEATVEELFAQPAHPYTRALLRAVPRLDGGGSDLAGIPGRVPDPGELPGGCSFHPRCHEALDVCRQEAPGRLSAQGGAAAGTADAQHLGRCWLLAENDPTSAPPEVD